MSELVLRRFCKIADITVETLRSADQSPATAIKRQYVAVALKERGYSSVKIGQLINRHHASVLHACKVFPTNCYTWHQPVAYRIPKGKRLLKVAAE